VEVGRIHNICNVRRWQVAQQVTIFVVTRIFSRSEFLFCNKESRAVRPGR